MTTPVSRVFGIPGGGKALATAQHALAVADATAEQTQEAVAMAQGEIASSQADRAQLWAKINSNTSRVAALEHALSVLGAAAGGDSVAALLPLLAALEVRMDELEREPGPAGNDGKSVELMAGADAVLWRQTGGQWQTLFTFDQVRGANGEDGSNGRTPEMGVVDGAIAWRYTNGSWQPLVDLDDLKGTDGTDGVDGEDGSNGLTPQLRAGAAGIETRTGAGAWSVLVPYAAITGPAGDDGEDGSNGLTPQLRAGAAGIEMRTGDGAWTSLVPYAAIKGPAGDNGLTPQIRAGATGLETRVGDGAWTVLLPYSTITGPAGADVTNLRIGLGVSPVILLGGQQDVTISWDTPMPSAAYELRVGDGAIVGKGTWTKKSQTAAGVVLTVKSTALAISAGTVIAAVARS